MHIGLGALYILEGASGGERVMRDIAQAMLARGHEVTVFAKPPSAAQAENGGLALFALPDGAETILLDFPNPRNRAEVKERIVRSGVDVLLSMFTGDSHLIFPWLLAGTGIPLVAAEAVNPAKVADLEWNAYEYYGAIGAADYIQVLLEPYRDHFPPALRRRIVPIGNAMPPAHEVDWQARAEKKEKSLLGVGRFDERHKRFSVLIRAWAALAGEFPDWTLTLVGDGPARELYQSLVDSLELGGRVSMPGAAAPDEVDPWYEQADVLCLPSRQEGFPLVLLEAAAWSLPLVGSASCTASACLIPPEAGALARADTPAALAETLRPILAAAPEDRRKMGEAACRSFSRFTPERVFGEWEALLVRAAERRGRTRLDRALRDQWSPELIREATVEIVSRSDPFVHEKDGDAARSPQAVLAKLLASHQALEREHSKLAKKYEVLLTEYQALAARAGGLHGGIRKGKRR